MSMNKTIEDLKKLREHYAFGEAELRTIDDVIALLKEKEARVMTLDELTEIYVEFKGDNCPIRLTNFDLQKIVQYAVDGDCRLWTCKPTDGQRMAVKWE